MLPVQSQHSPDKWRSSLPDLEWGIYNIISSLVLTEEGVTSINTNQKQLYLVCLKFPCCRNHVTLLHVNHHHHLQISRYLYYIAFLQIGYHGNKCAKWIRKRSIVHLNGNSQRKVSMSIWTYLDKLRWKIFLRVEMIDLLFMRRLTIWGDTQNLQKLISRNGSRNLWK